MIQQSSKQQTSMSGRKVVQKSFWLLVPCFGTSMFVALYIIATFFYPGGSQSDKKAVGFSWINNYWCNLLNEYAVNGQANPAKPIALMAMLILCITLTFFWLSFPRQINLTKKARRLIQVSGSLAMSIAFLLFTGLAHDLIINLAAILGAVATIATIAALYKRKCFGLFTFGLCNIVLVALNNICYYNQGLIKYLPVIQKITFATFLAWVCSINISLLRQSNKCRKPPV